MVRSTRRSDRLFLAAIVAAACTVAVHSGAAAQPGADAIHVGVRYDLPSDPSRRRAELENMRRLRFTVVATSSDLTPGGLEFFVIERVLAGDAGGANLRVPASEFGVVPVTTELAAGGVREGAWTHVARGARGVIFDDWPHLQQNDAKLAEAGAFADNLARNPALYGPLRRVQAAGTRAFTIEGSGSDVEVQWLESDDALMLIGVNHAAESREVTLRFAADVPEAIWQNMLTGAAVNFVAGPTGPVYQRVFAPRDVLVLMIRKRLK